MKGIMIAIGNFLFKHRNLLFPLYVLALFVLFRPPSSLVHGFESMQVLAAILTCVAGLVVRGIVIGLAYIKRGGLNKKVYAANLVTEGMFSVCRNPLYVGNMLIYTGLFLMFGNGWCVLTGVVSFWFIYECIIAAEENFLSAKFGAAYAEYCRDVPRWLPRISKVGEAVSGMKFDWKKVIFKDYPTMSSSMIFLVCIRLWDILANKGLSQNEAEVWGLIGAIVLVSITALATRAVKKSARPSTSDLTPEAPIADSASCSNSEV